MEYKAPVPSQDYKVVIKCFTYNQEKYIEDALKGFVRQKTNFPFCAIVVDDCSTDGNVEIIKRYEREYPDIIKGIYLPVNMYRNPEKQKYVKPWLNAAQYIAICEGDDYWIDDYKLQRQVDFLDSHPDYIMHFHNAIVRYEDHTMSDHIMRNFISGNFDTRLLFEKWLLPFASVVFRKSLYDSNEYKHFMATQKTRVEMIVFLVASKIGKVYGLSECLSVYRKNNGGVSNKMSVSFIHQLLYDYAIATNDKESIQFRKKATIRTLSLYIPKLLKGDKDAKELLQVAIEIDKMIPVKAFFRMLYRMPINFLRNVIRH